MIIIFYKLNLKNQSTPEVLVMVQQLTNPASIHEDTGSISGLSQLLKGSSIALSCGVGHRLGLDPGLLWLWHRPIAIALIQPLTWE